MARAAAADAAEEHVSQDYMTLRSRAIRTREAALDSLRASRHRQLAELFVAVRDRPRYTDFEAGLSGRKRRKLVEGEPGDHDLPELADFVQECANGEAVSRLDVSLPPLTDTLRADAGRTESKASPAAPPPLADALAEERAIVEDSEEDAEGEADEDVAVAEALAPAAAVLAAQSSSKPAISPGTATPDKSRAAASPSVPPAPVAPQIALTGPSTSSSAVASPQPLSASATPQPPAPSPAVAGPSPSPAAPPSPGKLDPRPVPVPTYESQFGIREVSSDYATALPPVPQDVLRNRLNAALMLRASNKKASKSSANQMVQPDLYKLHVRSQHMSAKSLLYPGKRIHNTLGTDEWEVGIDEMRAIRAFERIEELKASKAWSFRQPKKQRTGVVPKAHWDHVLDEMRWMHTDFRQETRWKVVTAYNLASACRAYVRAAADDRHLHVLSVKPPRLLSDDELGSRLSGEEPLVPMDDVRPSGAAEEGAGDAERDDNAAGEEDGVVTVPAAANPASRPIVPIADAPAGAGKGGGSTGNQASTSASQSSRSQAEASRAHSQAQHIQNLITFRNPIFDTETCDTVVGTAALAAARGLTDTDAANSTEDDPFLEYDLNALFPDLPLYSDFVIANDPSLARRVEDSSAWSGRLAHVTRLLETKPTLVSSLQPGRMRSARGWSPALADTLEDVKESLEGRQPPPESASTLFAGRKPKDAAVGEVFVKPQEVPNAESRAVSLLWLPEEDSLLLNLQEQYGLNWSLIAQIFNSATHRPASDYRLSWDVCDRWDKLVGPGSKKTLPDGTEIVRPPPEWQPPLDRLNRPVPIIADGSKKKTRHAIIVEAMKKVQKKREMQAAKQPATGFPRRINMNMHESHNIPPRPNWTPMEWTVYKAEQEAQKHRLRQQQQAQAQAAAAMRQQQQQQQQHQQQQTPQNAAMQPPRPPSSLPPQMAAAQAAAAHASPTNPAAALPGSPNAPHGHMGSSASPRNVPQQLNGHVPVQMPQLTADQLAALQARQRELLQAQAQAIAAQRAASQQATGP